MEEKKRHMEKPFNYEFEPVCKWQNEEGRDILEVHSQGFKKEQLKVLINNKGILTVSGERPLDKSLNSRFRKEIRISRDLFNPDEVRAKFAHGILYVIIPKKIQQNGKQNPQINQEKVTESPKSQINQEKVTENPMSNEATEKIIGTESGTKCKLGQKSWFSRLKMRRRTAVKVAAAVAVAVVMGVGVYGTYMYTYGSSYDEN